MAEFKEPHCKDKVWVSGEETRGTHYDRHRKPLDFSRSAFGFRSFRKANHTVLEDPQSLPTKNNRILGPPPTDQNSVFENRSTCSFESSLPACHKEAPRSSDKKNEFSIISGEEQCQTLDSHNALYKSSGSSSFHQTCTGASQQWTDKCLGLTDGHSVLSNVDSHSAEEVRTIEMSSVSNYSQLCDMPPVQQTSNCTDQWNSIFLEQNNSDTKRICIELDTPASSTLQYVTQVNEATRFATATCLDLTVNRTEHPVISLDSCSTNVQQIKPPAESGLGLSPPKIAPQVKRLKLFTKDELKEKAYQDLMKSTGVPINTPRLSTEDEFNCSIIALPSKEIFIGRLFTHASDVKVGPIALTASLSAANWTYNLKIEIKDIKEWKGHFRSEPFVMALTVNPGICQKLVSHLSVKFRLSGRKFYNTGSALTIEKYIVIQLITPLNDRCAATLCDIIKQHKGPREVEIDFNAPAASMHELLHDVVVNHLEPMNSLEEKVFDTSGVVVNSLEPMKSLEEEDDKKSVRPHVFTRKTRTSQKQLSILDQSLQESMHEPLCADEHKMLLIYNPSGSKFHFEITGGDLNCLHPREYLNDKIINFYLTYLLCDTFVNIKERVHVFSSFFLGKLMESPKDRKSSLENIHDRVKSWTRHVDIFSKEYIVMPVCLRSHWFVAIVCFPEKFDPINKSSRQPSKSDQQQSDNASDTLEIDSEESVGGIVPVVLPTQEQLTSNPTSSSTRPCIVVLDSLGIRRTAVLHRIRSYLTKEWKVKRSTDKNFSSMPPAYPSVPLQTNNLDCGIYVLQYVEGFLKSVSNSSFLPRSQEEWASYEDISQKRQHIRTLIETLSKKGVT